MPAFKLLDHGRLDLGPPRERETHEQAFRHFPRCIREEHPQTDSPGERAVVVMRIIDVMYQSADAGGREVRVGP